MAGTLERRVARAGAAWRSALSRLAMSALSPASVVALSFLHMDKIVLNMHNPGCMEERLNRDDRSPVERGGQHLPTVKTIKEVDIHERSRVIGASRPVTAARQAASQAPSDIRHRPDRR